MTPWRIEDNERGTFLMHGNYCVARIDGRAPRQMTDALNPHLASSHDELVAALRKIDQAWPAHGSATDNAIADAMAQVARAALAKVES